MAVKVSEGRKTRGDGPDVRTLMKAHVSWKKPPKGASPAGLLKVKTSGPAPAGFAAVCILLIIVVTLLAPLFAPAGRDSIDLDNILSGPSPRHILGTDELGRDILTRLIYGGRFTLLVAFLSVSISLVIGITLGCIAGRIGGGADLAVMALVNVFLSVPVFLVLLTAASLFGGNFWTVPLVIGCTSWMEIARMVRAELLRSGSEEYVAAAHSLGLPDSMIVLKHMLPQALPAVVVAATIGFSQAMLVESSLSFLGFGIQPPLPTWGNMLYNANTLLRRAPVAAFAPGFTIFISCLCFNLVGNGFKRLLANR